MSELDEMIALFDRQIHLAWRAGDNRPGEVMKSVMAIVTEARRVALSKAIEVCSGLSDGIECVNAIEALLPSEVKP